MTGAHGSSAIGPGKAPRFAARWVLAIAVVTGIAHLAASFDGGYWFDEAYMLAIGREHLDFGSADQPPLAPLLAGLMDLLAPDSLVALRLPAVLATAAAVLVAGLVARELGGDRRAQVLTAGAQATTLWTSLAGHWLTPYALEPLEWSVLFWLLTRWLRRRDDRLLLVFGAVAGIAAETKFQVLLLALALLLSVLVLGPRELLRRPLLWAGAGIAAVIAAPTLIWQAAHGWPQLRMGAIVTAEAGPLYGGRAGLAVALLVLAGVAGTALSLYGSWRLLRAPELREHRFLALTAIALYAFFVVVPGRPYYLNGMYAVLAAAGALGLQRRREAGSGRGRWIAWPAFGLSAAVAVTVLVASGQATSPEVGRRIAERAAAVYRGLPPEQRDDAVVMGRSYIHAAYVDAYSSAYDLPKAYSPNRSYGYFPPPPEGRGTVVYVGDQPPQELRPHFAEVRQVAGGADGPGVWLCSGKERPWSSLWPELRSLVVG